MRDLIGTWRKRAETCRVEARQPNRSDFDINRLSTKASVWEQSARELEQALAAAAPTREAECLCSDPRSRISPDCQLHRTTCLCPATSEYDPPCPRHGVLGIGKTGKD